MNDSWLILLVLVGILSLTGMALAASVVRHRRAEQALRQAHAQLEDRVAQRTGELRRVEQEILSISEREQQRIGQDLHDGLCQQLTGIALMGRALSQRLKAISPQAAKDVAQFADVINQAIVKTRDLVRGLYPATLADGDLVSALEELAASTEMLTATACTVTVSAPLAIRDQAIALHLYRIAQEALQNAVKHGKAGHIHIDLLGQPQAGALMLIVRDNGVGLRVPERRQGGRHGMGLSIMRHRASLIGAALEIQRSQTQGTTVICTLRHPSVCVLEGPRVVPAESLAAHADEVAVS